MRDMQNSTDTPKRIMILEDNELNLKLFSDILTINKYKILPLSDSNGLLDNINNFQPHLIIMDIQLREVSGLDLIKEIKANSLYDEIPVIAVTAFAMKTDAKMILEHGFEGYIAKPVSIKTFIAQVDEYITKSKYKMS